MKLLLALLSLAMLSASAVAEDVRHVVAFKFKSDVDQALIRKAEKDFAALKTKIDVIKALEWGTNISNEGFTKGFTHCWIVTFKNEADRDAYIAHPAHKEFVNTLGPILDEPFVLDFKTRS
jgi:Stress responsive A/B Barrel Domain